MAIHDDPFSMFLDTNALIDQKLAGTNAPGTNIDEMNKAPVKPGEVALKRFTDGPQQWNNPLFTEKQSTEPETRL